MTMHDDEARLDEARLAVVEVALAEECGAVPLPDTWSRLQQSARPSPIRNAPSGRWAAAALLLFGVTIVGAVMVLTRGPDPVPVAPLDQSGVIRDPNGPRDLAAALERLAAPVDWSATVKTNAVRLPTSRQWLDVWHQSFLEALASLDSFGPRNSFPSARDTELDEALGDALVAALRTARLDATPAADVVWNRRVVLHPERRPALQLLVADDRDTGLHLAWAGVDGPIPVIAALPIERLWPAFQDSQRKTLRIAGIAIGDGGLDALSPDVTRVRWYETDGRSLAQLARFPKLRSLDLTGSPKAHGAAALHKLGSLPLRSLILLATEVSADRLRQLVGHPELGAGSQLEELFLVSPGPIWASFSAPAQVMLAPALDDAALTAIGALATLREVWICGGSFGDRGLAELARLPALRRLALLRCPNLTARGWATFVGSPLEELDLRACTPPTLAACGPWSMPRLLRLRIGSLQEPVEANVLATLPALEELSIDGYLARDDLATIATLPRVQKLGLHLTPPLQDSDLEQLRGARQLRRLNLGSHAISDPALASLRAALPGCSIGRDRW